MANYTKIVDGIEAKIVKNILYVRTTSIKYGCLEQGGRIGKIYKGKYDGNLADATEQNQYGISDIDRLIESGQIIRQGNLIL